MNSNTGVTRNSLSHEQFFRLCTWLCTATLDGLTPAMALAHTSDAMGFTVTLANLKSARRASGAEFVLKGERVEAARNEPTLCGPHGRDHSPPPTPLSWGWLALAAVATLVVVGAALVHHGVLP